MINQALHLQPVPLDRNQHRFLRLKLPITDWSIAARMNTAFVAANEFGDAARDLPLVFVEAAKDEKGQAEYAPVAVLGLTSGTNLYVDGTRWRVGYIPALLRLYPFCAAAKDEREFTIGLDIGWPGISGTDGDRLFDDHGQYTPLMDEAQKQLSLYQGEIQRTRLYCNRLRDLGVLQSSRFDATLPNGEKLAVDGFFTIDDRKLTDLSDADIVELHKSGALSLAHAHFISLGNMNRLLGWHNERLLAADPNKP